MKINFAKIKEKFDQKATLENLAYFIVFCLPFYLIKIDIFSLPTNLLEILMGIFLILFLADKNNWEKLKTFSRKNKNYLIIFSIIIFGLLVSTLVNENIWKGLGIIKSWFILPFLFCWAVVSLLPLEKIIRLFQSFYFSAVIVACIGIVFIFLGKTTYDNRLEVFFNSPNYLAMYLAPGILIGILAVKKSFWRKYLPLAILFGALLGTYSYLAWATIILVAIILSPLASKAVWKKIFTGMLVMFVVFIIFASRTQKMADITNLNARSSLASRLMIWRSAGRILSENWFLGIGPNNFQNQYLANQKYYPPYLEWAVPHPHSLYLAFWLSGGLISFLAFLAMLYWWLRDFFGYKKRETVLGLVSLSIILYFLIHGLADTTYFKNDLAVIFWLAFLALL